jgi:hypothetical protein
MGTISIERKKTLIWKALFNRNGLTPLTDGASFFNDDKSIVISFPTDSPVVKVSVKRKHWTHTKSLDLSQSGIMEQIIAFVEDFKE